LALGWRANGFRQRCDGEGAGTHTAFGLSAHHRDALLGGSDSNGGGAGYCTRSNLRQSGLGLVNVPELRPKV
jgi:hypothetical protein